MAINERLRLIIESTADASGLNKIDASLNRLATSLDKATKEAKELNTENEKSVQSFKRVNLSLTDVIMGFQQLSRMAQQAGEFLSEAGKQEGIRIEFRRMAEQAGLSANEVLQAMESVAQGTISTQRQMQAANKLFLANMDLTADQIGQLMAIARDRARGMGISVEKAFGDIIQGVTKSQPLILDNLGIIVKMGEASEIMAAALGKSVDDLTAQERSMALVNQVLRDNGDAMDRVIGRQDTMADNLARVTTNLENITVAMGAFAAGSVLVEDTLSGTNDLLDTASKFLILTASNFDALAAEQAVFNATRNEALAAMASDRTFEDAMRRQLEAVGLLEPVTETLVSRLDDLAFALATNAIKSDEFASQWRTLSSQFEDGPIKREINFLVQEFEDGLLTATQFLKGIESLSSGLDDLAPDIDDVAESMKGLAAKIEGATQATREFTVSIKDAQLEQREALASLVDDQRDSSRRIAGFDDDLQRQLTKTALQGTQRRADIGVRFGDKQADIALKRGDNITDLDREIAGARISVHREFWQEIQRINAQGDENETDAIRARDARALTEARNQEQKEVNSATQAHENEERALEESNRNKRREIETATQRALRDAGIARQRQLRDQHTGELRSIQSQRTASEIRINNERQAQAIAESDLIGHWNRRVAIAEEGARREGQFTQLAAVLSSKAGATKQVATRQISDGRGRKRTR